jgi:hypothetical protein
MSTLKVNTIQNASGVEKYLCQAWVNFNGTGTVAERASGNVAGVADNGTGSYTITFINAMPDANYTLVGTASRTAAQQLPRIVFFIETDTYSTTAVQIRVAETNAGGALDCGIINIAVFR